MVTVVKKPTGHKIGPQALEATITDSGGDALVTALYNGLGTGDYVYIDSDIDEYNGFWYVTTIDSDQFKISEYAGADFVEYFQDLDIEYYVTAEHDWNSIFLPIVYKASNDRWPINTADTTRTVSSSSDDNGYTNLVLSGAIKSGVKALSFVKISNAGASNGVWQIVEVTTTSDITIDLPYPGSLAGATVQYYYNNYQVKVKIYAGLPISHPWQAKKPFEEVAELSLTPDEDGIVMFSVADYIKSKVAIKNNTTIFSYPLNLDAFTGFYIATSESYDSSDGYSLATDQQTFTNDSFEGYAIAGKLPFKNVYSGDYADYVYTDGAPALWLTLFNQLIGIENKYFDISYIKNVVGAFTLTINKYVSDYLTTIETINYEDQGIGVYRIPIEFDSVYDRYCIYITTIASAGTPGVTSAITLPALSAGVNIAGPDTNWTTGANPSVSLTATSLFELAQSDIWANDYAFIPGYTYEVTPSVDYNNDVPLDVTFVVLDASNNILYSDTDIAPIGAGTMNGPISFVAPAGAVKYGYYASFVNGFGSNTNQIDLNAFTDTEETTPGSPAVLGAQITEEICIDIIEDCDAQGGIVPTDIRLLEDGSYRLLE